MTQTSKPKLTKNQKRNMRKKRAKKAKRDQAHATLANEILEGLCWPEDHKIKVIAPPSNPNAHTEMMLYE